jgi:lysozyme
MLAPLLAQFAIVPVAAADTTLPVTTLMTTRALTGSQRAVFNEPVGPVTARNLVLRVAGSTANLPASISCADGAGVRVDCRTTAVRSAALKPALPLVPGERYQLSVNPCDAQILIADVAGNATDVKTVTFRSSTAEEETSAATRYAWRTVASGSAQGGSYVTDRLAGAQASFSFSGSAVTWITVKGPSQGKASVYIDGAYKGTFNNYAARGAFNVKRSFSGLSAGTHRITIRVLGVKGSVYGRDKRVAIDGFQVGATLLTSPWLRYDWASVTTASASAGAYATSDLPGAWVAVTFRGVGLDWYTVRGPAQGKATVYVDGTLKTTVDNYAASTTYGVRIPVGGLTDGLHTIRILVLGSKQAASSGTRVSFDRFVVNLPAATGSASTRSSAGPEGEYTPGMDVSHWQETIDWTAVGGSDVKFSFTKATDGREFVDPRYTENKSGAAAAGIAFTAYHFARPARQTVDNDAVTQGNHFVDNAQLGPGNLIPVLDLENTGCLGVTALQNWTRQWLETVTDRLGGVKPFIYTNPSFWHTMMGDTTEFAATGYPLWIAHWRASSPALPAANWAGAGWTFWQWTDCGEVPGIAGCVDRDVLNGTDLTPVTL